MELLSQKEICECFKRWKKENPSPASELNYKNAYTLLVAVVLSAQATDKSVNIATKDLFEIADTPQKMIALGEEKLIEHIKSIGLYRNKAKFIIQLSKDLIEKYNSQVPDTMEELTKLSGVGRKTANVVLNVIFNQPSMPVDTHLLRICPKIGFTEGTTTSQIETELLQKIPKEFLHDAHHWLLLHGRYVCTAKNPKCAECIINNMCKHNF